MKKIYIPFIGIILLAAFFIVSIHARAEEVPPPDWAISSISGIENNPLLIHYIYEISRPPYSILDKIRLHRVVLSDRMLPIEKRRQVIMILPGTWNAGGWSGVTDPNVNTMLFLANNGYDVYTIDYRTLNIPDMAYDQFPDYGIDLCGVAQWTDGVYRDDVKACVEKIKQLSGAGKLFMGGFSRGGALMYIYASKYQDDLCGLVSLDGGIKDSIPLGTTLDESTYNQIIELFQQELFVDSGSGLVMHFLSGVYGLDDKNYANWKLAGVLPYATYLVGEALPSDYKVISDYVADKAYHLWDFLGFGDGTLTNYEEGYIDRDVLVKVLNEFHRYTPNRQFLEEAQMSAWDDVPYLDYDDNPIYLPTVAFLSKLMCPYETCKLDFLPNMTRSKDVTITFLEGYGHMDVLFGNNSLSDVKQPLLQWLNNQIAKDNPQSLPNYNYK